MESFECLGFLGSVPTGGLWDLSGLWDIWGVWDLWDIWDLWDLYRLLIVWFCCWTWDTTKINDTSPSVTLITQGVIMSNRPLRQF